MQKFYEHNGITKDTEWSFDKVVLAEEIKQDSFFESAKRITEETKSKNVLIYTDYDTDGLTSGINLEAILSKFFKEAIVTSNNKEYEGYNLTKNRINTCLGKFKDQDAEVVLVTADVGVTDVEVLNWAMTLDKIDYSIVLDHHENHGELPGVTYLVDLKLDSNKAEIDREYCTAGLTWLWALQIARIKDDKKLISLVKKLLPWTAIATIADMVPLNYGNFGIIDEGLRMVNDNEDYAYKQSMELFITKDDKYEQISYLQELLSTDVGFNISPLINSSTRMTGTTDMAIKAITNENFMDFNNLKALNEKRKLATKVATISSKTIFNKGGFAVSFIDERFLAAQANKLETKDLAEAKDLLSYAAGLAGIVASTLLKETEGAKASFTGVSSTSTNEDGEVITTFHGSLRARPGVNLVKALDAAKIKFPDSVKGGGHAGAAGLSIKSTANLMDVLAAMAEEIEKCEVEPAVVYDADDFNPDEFLELPLIFGMGRQIPAFRFKKSDLDIVDNKFHKWESKRSKKGTDYFTPTVEFKGKKFQMMVFDKDFKAGFDFNSMCLVPGYQATKDGKELVFKVMEQN